MKEVPDIGSIPVSPITLTAIAPRRNVVSSNTVENIIEGSIGNPPKIKIIEIAKNERIMNIGMCDNGHSYQPLPSTNSSPFSPEKAPEISPKIPINVGVIFRRPNSPPPRIAPIAIVLIIDSNASHCTVGLSVSA